MSVWKNSTTWKAPLDSPLRTRPPVGKCRRAYLPPRNAHQCAVWEHVWLDMETELLLARMLHIGELSAETGCRDVTKAASKWLMQAGTVLTALFFWSSATVMEAHSVT